ncbi:MAG: N-acetylmuramoyl-L-alanine amidase [Synergistaceae bacterium]|nr:N-acetylmuramoyl-L-alanine amidase [Synergistaceae bacterium]
MERLSRALLLCLLVLLWLVVPSAWGSASLYRGADVLGTVATTTGPSSDAWVSIEDVGALLGFTASRSGEELLLSRGDGSLRVVLDATAAWRDIYLVPLYAAPFERDGRIWLDTASVAALFQRSVGSGERDRLRFGDVRDVPDVPVEAPSRQEIEDRPPAPITVVEIPTVSPAPLAPTPTGPRASRDQERYETFRPGNDTRRPSVPSADLGEIKQLRWSVAQRRIRAVIDANDGADPDVWMEGGAIHASFASAPATIEGTPGPYENVSVEAKRDARGVELIFASNGTRVEKMLLDSPRRIVLDFFFPADVSIREVARVAPVVEPKLSVPVAPAPVAPAPAPRPSPDRPRGGRKIVVVDPGHGGKDPGASANGVREKDVNLAIGLMLEKILKDDGFDVVMTRRTDVYLKLQERTDIANKADADVFVSVHVNALPSAKRASGFEIYIMALPTDKDALDLAKIENREYVEEKAADPEAVDQRTELLLRILGDMQQNNKINESTGLAESLFEAGRRDGIPMRRVAQAPFFVLRGAGMPAVLLETGFVTNATEAKLLAHSGYQQKIATAMAAGIADYLR